MSYKKYAAQSNTAVGSAYRASNAVDRNIATCMRTDPIGINSPDKKVWWQVDLGGVYTIYSVNILFKSYAGSGMFESITIKDVGYKVIHNVHHLQFAGFEMDALL